jgi:hypothetical protein
LSRNRPYGDNSDARGQRIGRSRDPFLLVSAGSTPAIPRMRALWEVCPKHRKIRRENPAGATSTWKLCEVAAVFVLFCQKAARSVLRNTGAPLTRSSSNAGCLGANQAMLVQVRLTVPILLGSIRERRASAAQLGLQNRANSGRHRDAVPFSRAVRLVSKSAGLHPAVRGA